MAILSENMVFSKTRTQDLRNVRQLNCWGSELSDVSLVSQMPHVQVLSLSVNNITTLSDFGTCKNLQELYLRENKIKDLNQILHLQELANLKKLWLSGNPCTEHPNYRLTVLKALPHLETLDNIHVSSDEVSQAETQGNDLTIENGSSDKREPSPHENHYEEEEEDDEDYTQHNSDNSEIVSPHHGQTSTPRQDLSSNNSRESPPTRHTRSPSSPQIGHTGPNDHNGQVQSQSQVSSPQQRHAQQRLSYPGGDLGQNWPNSHQQQQFQLSNSGTRPPPGNLSAFPTPNTSMVRSTSINDYTMFNGNNGSHMSAHNVTVADPVGFYPVDSSGISNGGKHYPKESRKLLPKGGKNRNANILSAVLCLIKELDYCSLEVVDTEIHCRMEEIGN